MDALFRIIFFQDNLVLRIITFQNDNVGSGCFNQDVEELLLNKASWGSASEGVQHNCILELDDARAVAV
jgi:hypothetical protein